jgi:hypothetical protein
MLQAFALALVLTLSGGSKNTSYGLQNYPTPQNTIPAPPGPTGQTERAVPPTPRLEDNDPLLTDRQLYALNVLRQKSLVSDTNKLLKLATELNAEIQRTNPSSLTPVQLRKVAEIEKLAHKVKEEMSVPLQGSPTVQLPREPERH